MNAASGTTARPRVSFAKVRSIVAMMLAAASHMLDSANAWPGQILPQKTRELSMPNERWSGDHTDDQSQTRRFWGRSAQRPPGTGAGTARGRTSPARHTHPGPASSTWRGARQRRKYGQMTCGVPYVRDDHGAIRDVTAAVHIVRLEPVRHAYTGTQRQRIHDTYGDTAYQAGRARSTCRYD